MEDLAVLDLLECSLCMEPLDLSAKVLPYQHTFCKPCLPTNLLLESIQEREWDPLGTPRDRSGRYVCFMDQEDLLSSYIQDLQLQLPRQGQNTQEGDCITFIKQVDENWVEGKLEDKIGIFPLQLTEPNPAAHKLLEKRKRRDSVESHPRSGTKVNTEALAHRRLSGTSTNPARPPNISLLNSLNYPSLSQSLQPPLISSNAHTAYSKTPQLATFNRPRLKSSCKSLPKTKAGSFNRGLFNLEDTWYTAAFKGRVLPSTQPSKRDTAVCGSRCSNIHLPRCSASQCSTTTTKEKKLPVVFSLYRRNQKMNGESPPTITMALINPQAPPLPSESKMSTTQQLSISVCAALYSYTPHRSEELELRKGEMVGVYGKFKEGWLRGLSLRTGKVGILPANYVTPVLRTSARFHEQTKPAIPSTSTLSTKRHTQHKPQAVVLALDRVNADVPSATMPMMSSAGSGRAPQQGGKQGWGTVRHTLHASHRGLPLNGSYSSSSTLSLQPPPQDLGLIYTFGRSPVLPKKRNGLFSNPIQTQQRTYKTAPSTGGYQTGNRDPAQKEASTTPQSILVKPDSHKHNAEKAIKSVRFLTQDEPQTTKMTPPASAGHLTTSSQPGLSSLDHWNPSAILGRDGSSLVLKDTKTPLPRRSTGQDHATIDCLSLNMKPMLISNQSSPSKHRVLKGYNTKTDAELTLTEGEIVVVQRPRLDGRLLVTQEISGKTGLLHSSILEILDRVL
ncbi:LOW QUALITY PROTEIN: E3 ubiquitin-protein ligase SH3RF1-like [Myxocyprinus asiaticus]|uniref:LOW QUALITY PROTEIN: E3 ubiquitin-protein ligase SH3RF1-like n=1 Tax=Myxocyprinus asiaticus TaxID=70543 RepID=UPI00222367F3|nr:LOW QUALITY PROTEIN: E3 ubiquitin-protein ligase SH3RF1-like [Myxocyprinus asiaticus]